MNPFAAIDEFFFGSTLSYVGTASTSVGEAVNRLRAVTKLGWLPFRSGLFGSVDADRVAVQWHNAWIRSGVHAQFVGRFVQSTQGTRLEGTISCPLWRKAILYISMIGFPLVLFVVWFSGQRGAFDALPFWAVIAGTTIVIATDIFVALFTRGDAQKIADALDAALS